MQELKITLKEQVLHTSEFYPYSLHHTITESSWQPALYLHWHEEFEFFYLETGSLIMTLDDVTYELQAGDAIFIPSHVLHSAICPGRTSCSFYALVFSPKFCYAGGRQDLYHKYVSAFLNAGQPYSKVLTSSIPWQKECLKLLQDLFAPYPGQIDQDTITVHELKIDGTLLLLWNLLYQNHLSVTAAKQDYLKYNDVCNDVILYIQQNYQYDILLSELASRIHLSEGQFCRVFKKHMAVTPFEYISRYRIMKSCYLLLNTDKKIADIAISCGFSNISHFNRLFQRYMKTTPSDYRRFEQI